MPQPRPSPVDALIARIGRKGRSAMLTEEQINERRPERVAQKLYKMCAIGACLAGPFISGLLMLTGQSFTITAVLMGSSIGAGAAAALLFFLHNTTQSQESRIRDRPGYQLVWMLKKDGYPDNRIERRDSPCPDLNTSEWALYEPLGGADRHMFIASRSGKDRDKMAGVSELRITRTSGDVAFASSSVCVRNTRTRTVQSYSVWYLLRILNATDGLLGEVALSVLFRDHEKTRFDLRKATEEFSVLKLTHAELGRRNEVLWSKNVDLLSKNGELASVLKRSQDTLTTLEKSYTHLRRQNWHIHDYFVAYRKTAKIAVNILEDAKILLGMRSVRATDVKAHIELRMKNLPNIPASRE